jgi:hypothetical protein
MQGIKRKPKKYLPREEFLREQRMHAISGNEDRAIEAQSNREKKVRKKKKNRGFSR